MALRTCTRLRAACGVFDPSGARPRQKSFALGPHRLGFSCILVVFPLI